MVNINQIMKQAQEMQKKMVQMQEKLASTEFVGSSGGGSVEIAITGKGDMLRIKIDPALVDKDEVEVLEDLILAAFNDAKKKADNTSEDQLSGAMGGLSLPAGFKLPF